METEEFGIVLALITITVLILVFSFVFFFQRYKSSLLKLEKENQVIGFRAAFEAEERQKTKIAADLHDEVRNLIAVIKHEVDKDKINKAVVSDLLDKTNTSLHAIAMDLMPNTLIHFGLISAVEQSAILNRSRQRKIEVENNTGHKRETAFGKKDEVTIYRICLEILSNLIKHEPFTYLLISFQEAGHTFRIEFSHDGPGISNKAIDQLRQASVSGLGLKTLQARLLILNARINYKADEKTSAILIEIPHP